MKAMQNIDTTIMIIILPVSFSEVTLQTPQSPAAPQRAKLTTTSKKIQPCISDYTATQAHIREYPRVQ